MFARFYYVFWWVLSPSSTSMFTFRFQSVLFSIFSNFFSLKRFFRYLKKKLWNGLSNNRSPGMEIYANILRDYCVFRELFSDIEPKFFKNEDFIVEIGRSPPSLHLFAAADHVCSGRNRETIVQNTGINNIYYILGKKGAAPSGQ